MTVISVKCGNVVRGNSFLFASLLTSQYLLTYLLTTSACFVDGRAAESPPSRLRSPPPQHLAQGPPGQRATRRLTDQWPLSPLRPGASGPSRPQAELPHSPNLPHTFLFIVLYFVEMSDDRGDVFGAQADAISNFRGFSRSVTPEVFPWSEPVLIQTNCIMYADDIKLYHRIQSSSDTGALQADLDRLSSWSHTWRLNLNPTKCHVISFSLRKSPILATYTLNGIALQRRTETRDLGVILDAKLTFAAHVDHTIARASRMLGLIIRSMQLSRQHNRACFDHRTMLCTYYAHVRSILEYGCVVWSGAAATHLKRIERVQHRFVTWLARNSDKPTDSTDYGALLSHFNIRSMKSRFVQYDLMFLYNVHRARIDSADLLAAFGLSVPGRATRTLTLWHVPRGRVNTVQRSIFTRAPPLCNSFLNSDKTLDFFVCTACSYKSRAIAYSKTLDAYF